MRNISLQVLGMFVFISCQSNACHKADSSCQTGSHNSISISNQSNRTINYEIYWNYPDTAIGEYNPLYNGTHGLSKGEKGDRGAGPGSCWEAILKDGKKQWVYFFDEDSLETISWDTIRLTNRGLLERREITLDYLIANDFTVVFK